MCEGFTNRSKTRNAKAILIVNEDLLPLFIIEVNGWEYNLDACIWVWRVIESISLSSNTPFIDRIPFDDTFDTGRKRMLVGC